MSNEFYSLMEVSIEPQFKKPPQEEDRLVRKWLERIRTAKKHYEKFHKRVKHNRKLVAGFDWKKEPDASDFYMHRANLIHSTIAGMIPNLYARNPEFSVSQVSTGNDLKLFCKTLEKVTNRYLEKAGLKEKMKSSIRAALTCSFGAVKIMWQENIVEDPIIKQRISDAQDNLLRVEKLMMELNDPEQRADQEVYKKELEQTLEALKKKAEVVAERGLVIDRILTENILVDPSVVEFWDYPNADWIAQIIHMKRAQAEGLFGMRLDNAKKSDVSKDMKRDDYGGGFGGKGNAVDDDESITIYEIWDKGSQRVYTVADGCNFWLREPYSPQYVGQRWYPFFLLPFQTVDGCFIAPSLVDLTEKLQDEHNSARDKFNKHRDLAEPKLIMSADTPEKNIKSIQQGAFGELLLVETEGKPLNQVIAAAPYPPIDPQVYSTDQARYDWEQVTGLQDAARSTVVKPKTATEANIMQQALSGKVTEFRDQLEDCLQQQAQYSTETLLQAVPEEEVAKIMGENKYAQQFDPMTGQTVTVLVEQNYDWRPMHEKEEVFNLVQLNIRAGSTGMPNKQEDQEQWGALMQLILPLQQQIMQLQMQGADATVLINDLKETLLRYDDRLETEDFIPNVQPQIPQMQQQLPQS